MLNHLDTPVVKQNDLELPHQPADGQEH